MSERINKLTDKIVRAFQDGLSDSAKAAFTANELDSLTMLIKQALTEHSAAILEDLRSVTTKLKADMEKPDIGL